MTVSKAELVQDVARQIVELQDATQAVDEAAADYLEVNLTDLRCLGLIGRTPMTHGELAAATDRTAAAITVAVDRLERAELAERTADPDDRRRIRVKPTEQAEQLVELIWGPIEAEGTEILGGYTVQQLELVKDVLARGAELQRHHVERLNALMTRSTG